MAPLAKFVISNPSHKVMVRKVRAAARPSGARFPRESAPNACMAVSAQQCRLRNRGTHGHQTVRWQARGGLVARLEPAAAPNCAQFSPLRALLLGTARRSWDPALATGVLSAVYPRLCARFRCSEVQF